MRDFGAVFGRSGDGGFNGCYSRARSGDGGFMLTCISGRRGVIGFNIATSPRPVREKVRPAWSGGGREREKVRPAHEKWPKNGGLWRAGRVFSRKRCWRSRAGRVFSRKCRWRGCAGRSFSRASSRGVPLGACLAPRWRLRPAPRSRAQDLGRTSRWRRAWTPRSGPM